MEIIGASVKIQPEQKIWVNENCINPSAYLRKKIDEDMLN
jgi:hypothetical protein